ncbi:hypothetical protein SLS62_003637 [Diatrype stigma]|uniref:O-methyltransferase n=1 Tax=Diatrype stigma TaxID=117547 RepID=A0AAN9US12_9PEZI
MASQNTKTHPPEWGLVDAYVVKHLQPTSAPGTAPELPSNEVLAATTENCRKHGLPDIAVSAAQGKFLQLQARLIQARSILEIGTLGGFSTLWLATATPQTRVVSLEVSAEHAAVARENLARAGLLLPSSPAGAEVRVGAALDSLPALEDEVRGASPTRAPFDLVFLDADKENNWAYVDRAARLCRPGALIVVDNVVRGGRIADDDEAATDPRVMGARRVVENVGRESGPGGRFEATVLQTVGDKGYDGFMLVYVK